MATKNFFKEVINSISELKNLRVNTVIGDFKPNTTISETDLDSADQGQAAIASEIELSEAMLSNVDMLSGDISTTMTEGFANNSELREYHTLRENQGHEIVMRNVKVLTSIGKMIIDFARDSKDSNLNSIVDNSTDEEENGQGGEEEGQEAGNG